RGSTGSWRRSRSPSARSTERASLSCRQSSWIFTALERYRESLAACIQEVAWARSLARGWPARRTTRSAATTCPSSLAPTSPPLRPRRSCRCSSVARRKPPIAVSDSRGVRMLHVGGEAIQSAMRLDDPFALALDYTRCMMSFLLFVPQPRDALMIGLGGGSLAKFFHRRLRQTRVRAVEQIG